MQKSRKAEKEKEERRKEKRRKAAYILLLLFLFIFNSKFLIFNCSAQTDSVNVKVHSPKTASWLALVPGAGQIYNKKYWKLPLVYGGIGVSSYLIYRFGNETTMYRREVLARANNEVDKHNPKLEDKTDQQILEARNISRRNMEISIAACAIVYVLSIVDASVDAHLFYYDISDNLSLGVIPKIDFQPITRITTPSVALVLKF
ncbi:MAG: DUF5683 domain-containing protein [Bacteroidales bacterium]|jgi:cell division protein FtsB|nr:DUF5683 domain-containing protein [Bacteroidales bacterium]